MEYLFWTILGIVILLFIISILHDVYCYYWLQMPLGPWSVPFLGALYHIDSNSPHHSFKQLSENYGGILSLQMGLKDRVVYISDITLADQIFFDKNACDRPPLNVFAYLSKDVEGIGSVSYGKNFQKQKHLVVRAINTVRSTSAQYKINTVMKVFLKRISSMEGAFDPKESTQLMCTSLFCSLVYGLDYSDFNQPELRTILSNHRAIMTCISPFHPLNMSSFFWWIPNKWKTDLFQAIKVRDQIITRRCTENQVMREEERAQKENVINLLMSPKHQQDINISNIIMSAWTIFLAGIENTVSLYLWTILQLGIHTNMQEKLFQEIDNVLKKNSFNDLKAKQQLPYVYAFVLETLRVYQSNVLGIPHYTSTDIDIDNYKIPKGTMIMFGIWDILNNFKYWKNSSEFNPDRFLDKDKKLLDFGKLHSFIVFGRGHRMCPGSNLSLDIMLGLVVPLIYSFRISLDLKEGDNIDTGGKYVFGLEPSSFKINIQRRGNSNLEKFLQT